MAKTTPKPAELRVRNKGLRKVRVSELVESDFNFRTRPEGQAAALDGIIEEQGFYGYPLCYELSDGRIAIADGHLRKERLLAKCRPATLNSITGYRPTSSPRVRGSPHSRGSTAVC